MKRLLFPVVFLGLAISNTSQAELTKSELQVPGDVRWLDYGDLDGNKLTDLVVSYTRGSGPRASRYIAVFLGTPKGYPSKPDLAVKAPRSAAVFDLGDAMGDEADELLFLTATGIFAQSWSGKTLGKAQRIVSSRPLVGAPEEEDLITWNFLRKLPGGRTVAIVPAPRTLEIHLRGDKGFERWADIEVGLINYYDGETATFRRSARGGASGRPYSFRVTKVVPNLDFVDQTGDGILDLVTHYEDRVAVFPGTADGPPSRKPVRQQWFKVRTPAERRARDSRLSAQVLDLDGDQIADLAVTKIGGGITTLKSQVSLFRGLKGGGFTPSPIQVFEDEGFATLVQFVDVDGDGRLEMIHPHAEVSVVGMTRALLSRALELDLRIRRADRGPQRFFASKAVQTMEAQFGLDLSVGASVRGGAPIFGYDFNGDGRRDAVISQGADKMALFLGQAKGEPFDDDAKATLRAPGSHTTRVVPSRVDTQSRPEVLIWYAGRKDLAGKIVIFVNR